MIVDISIRKLTFDTETGRFGSIVQAARTETTGDNKFLRDVTIEIGEGSTIQEAVNLAVARALAAPQFHKEQS